MYKFNAHLPFLLFILIGLIILQGCAASATIPVAKYEILNETSKKVLINTSDTYTRIEKLQRRYVIVTAPNSPINESTFKPEIAGQSYDLTPELRIREAALEVLVKYTNVLYAFSSKDYVSDVDKASQELAGSVNNLLETSKQINTSSISNPIATMADIIGNQIANQQKTEALNKVMDMEQGNIETLSGLIIRSNDKIKKAVHTMRDRILAHANSARPKYGSAERYTFDKEIAEFIAETEEIDNSLDAMNMAISQIPLAHKEIKDELNHKATNFEALQILIQKAEQTNKFYRNLPN